MYVSLIDLHIYSLYTHNIKSKPRSSAEEKED